MKSPTPDYEPITFGINDHWDESAVDATFGPGSYRTVYNEAKNLLGLRDIAIGLGMKKSEARMYTGAMIIAWILDARRTR